MRFYKDCAPDGAMYIAEPCGVRWQAKRDTALVLEDATERKRRRRFALPAHSKFMVRARNGHDRTDGETGPPVGRCI
jgi:hypothetical protein